MSAVDLQTGCFEHSYPVCVETLTPQERFITNKVSGKSGNAGNCGDVLVALNTLYAMEFLMWNITSDYVDFVISSTIAK